MCFSVEVETDLTKLSKKFNASINTKAFNYLEELKNRSAKKYQYAKDIENRIYTKNWAPIICHVRGQTEIRPMRYQLLPSFCTTDKYTRINPRTGKIQEIKNTFNARLDSLNFARAWRKPFMSTHGIIAIKKFYEWVEKDGKKKLISFQSNEGLQIVPCLYDTWYSQDKSLIIQSFAIITTDPAKEVLELGHDRTPINLKEEYIQKWIKPFESNDKNIFKILNDTKLVQYNHEWA